jgi:hypothetical protein
VSDARNRSDKLDQIVVDLTGKIGVMKNTIELRSSDRIPLMAQIVSNHYVDWKECSMRPARKESSSRARFRLDYKCDRSEAAIMQDVSCTVNAERSAYYGYGMLLAEIGTPPGADVSQ